MIIRFDLISLFKSQFHFKSLYLTYGFGKTLLSNFKYTLIQFESIPWRCQTILNNVLLYTSQLRPWILLVYSCKKIGVNILIIVKKTLHFFSCATDCTYSLMKWTVHLNSGYRRRTSRGIFFIAFVLKKS